MYSLPQSTEIKKQLPKKAIFTKFDLKTSQKESFDSDISRIDIVGVISPETLPALTEGKEIKSLYVLAVQLKRKNYDSKNIALLTKLIPQNMILALHYENKVQFAIYHPKLISSNWQTSEDAKLSLLGLNLDSVWENIVKSIGDIEIEEGNTLTEQIASDDTKQKILSQISVLERKMANEKQPKRKREYFEQIKQLKNQI